MSDAMKLHREQQRFVDKWNESTGISGDLKNEWVREAHQTIRKLKERVALWQFIALVLLVLFLIAAPKDWLKSARDEAGTVLDSEPGDPRR